MLGENTFGHANQNNWWSYNAANQTGWSREINGQNDLRQNTTEVDLKKTIEKNLIEKELFLKKRVIGGC